MIFLKVALLTAHKKLNNANMYFIAIVRKFISENQEMDTLRIQIITEEF